MTSIDVPEYRTSASPTSNNFSVDVYPGDGLAAANWPSIIDPADLRMHIYQSREFLQVWRDTIGRARGIDCYLVVVRNSGRQPVLYLPLAIVTKFNVRLLRFMDADVADYNAPILAPSCELPPQEFKRLWSKTLSLLPPVDAIDLQKMPRDLLGASNPLTYLACVPYAASGRSLLLSALRTEVDSRPTVKRVRRKLRWCRQALSRAGAASVVVKPDASLSCHIFECLIELKRRQQMRLGRRDLFAMPGIVDFYRQMTSPIRIGKISQLSALTVDGKVVSARLDFLGRGRFYSTLIAYDTEFRRFQVGHLLNEHMIDRCLENGFDTFDLGVGDSSYKEKWATHRLALYSHERAMTAAGRLYLQMRRARRFLARTAMRLEIARWAGNRRASGGRS